MKRKGTGMHELLSSNSKNISYLYATIANVNSSSAHNCARQSDWKFVKHFVYWDSSMLRVFVIFDRSSVCHISVICLSRMVYALYCTRVLNYHYLTYNNLPSTSASFSASITAIPEPHSYAQASQYIEWQHAMKRKLMLCFRITYDPWFLYHMERPYWV